MVQSHECVMVTINTPLDILLTPSIKCQSEEVSRCLLLPAVQALPAESPNILEQKQTIPMRSVQIPDPLTRIAQQNGQFTPLGLSGYYVVIVTRTRMEIQKGM